MSVPNPAPRSNARLQRPDFPVSLRLTEAAAVVANPRRGMVVDLARRHGISRQSASTMVNRLRRACSEALAPRAPGRPTPVHSVVVDDQRLRAAVVALAVEGHASNAGTQACIQTMLDQHVATGRISQILQDAADRARDQLRACGMPQQPVCALADELYDHDRPVLTVMEDEHLAVLCATREGDADGTTWGVVLLELQEQGLRYAQMVTDGGTAMAAGFAESEVLKGVPHGSDTFHFLRAFGRDVRALRHHADRARTQAQRAVAAMEYLTAPSHGRGRPPRPVTLQAYEQATGAVAAIADASAAADFLFHETRALLEPVDHDGRLRSAGAAQTGLDTVAALLRAGGTHLRSLATLVGRASPALHTFREPLALRHEQLCRLYGAELVDFVGWAWVHRRVLHESLPRTQQELACRWALEVPVEHVREIWRAFANCHRSTSVLESFNATLRLHVHAHRGLTPSLLPLIVYRHNLRAFPRGVHRGEAPFVALGIVPEDHHRSWIERLFRPTPPAGNAKVAEATQSAAAEVVCPQPTTATADPTAA